MKRFVIFIILLLAFPVITSASGLNSSFKGSNYSGMTRESTVFESFGDVTGANVLIDHSGSNLLTYTEAFDNAAWTKTNVTVTADQVRGPGSLTNNADLLTPTAADSHVYQDATATVGTQYTCSFDLRTVTGNVNLSIHAYDQAHGAILGTKAILITPYWRRFYVSGTLVAGDTDVGCTIGGNTTWSTGENIYGVRAQVSENNEWNTNLGVYHPRLAGTNLPLHNLTQTNNPTSAYTDLQSSDGNRLPARAFDGVNQEYSKVHHDSMNIFDGDFTFTAYVQSNAIAGSDNIFYHGAWNTDGIIIYSTVGAGPGTFSARFFKAASNISVFPSTNGLDNDFHIFQLVRENDIATAYTDSIAGTPVDVSTFGIDGARTLYYNRAVDCMDGKMSYMRIDAQALSTDELAADRERILAIATNWSRDNQWSFSRSTVATKQFSAGGANTLTPTLVEVPANAVRVAGRGSGVLVEGQSQNVCHYSEEFDAAGTDWINTRCSVVNDSIITLNGTVTADTIHEDATLAQTHQIQQNNTIPTTNGEVYTASFYAKEDNRNWVRSHITGDNDGGYFDLSNCTVGSTVGVSTLSTERLPDGWCRCSITWTSGSTGNKSVVIYIGEADADVTFDGLNQDSFYLWGVQVEESPFATSYIPTPTNAAVTRTADDLSIQVHPDATNEYIIPELYAPNTPADKLSVYMEVRCQFNGVADIGESRQLLEISGDVGTATGARNRFRMLIGSDGRAGANMYDDASANHRIYSAVDVVPYDEWFSIRAFIDFSDLSRIDMWINESNAGMTYVLNAGTCSFDTEDTLIRIGQQYNSVINGNCHIRSLRINNREITP